MANHVLFISYSSLIHFPFIPTHFLLILAPFISKKKVTGKWNEVNGKEKKAKAANDPIQNPQIHNPIQNPVHNP